MKDTWPTRIWSSSLSRACEGSAASHSPGSPATAIFAMNPQPRPVVAGLVPARAQRSDSVGSAASSPGSHPRHPTSSGSGRSCAGQECRPPHIYLRPHPSPSRRAAVLSVRRIISAHPAALRRRRLRAARRSLPQTLYPPQIAFLSMLSSALVVGGDTVPVTPPPPSHPRTLPSTETSNLAAPRSRGWV
jgi:hypothetical protein